MQLAVNIVVLAAIYALIACGYVLIYRVSRVLNLAHGELMMLGAYMLLATASLFAATPWLAFLAAVGLSLLARVLACFLLMWRMTGEVRLGAGLARGGRARPPRGVVVRLWGARQQSRAGARAGATPPIVLPGGARISTFAALLVLTTVVTYAALFLFLRFGRWG